MSAQVAVENERCHRGSVLAVICRVVDLEAIRIIDHEPTLKPAVRLQRKPIEQRDDWGAASRFPR